MFKGEIAKHIDAISKRAAELQYVQTELNNKTLPVGDERTMFTKQMTEHFKWLRGQVSKTDKMFIRYVKLDK